MEALAWMCGLMARRANGAPDRHAISMRICAGRYSVEIDARGGDRIRRGVDIHYRAERSGRGRAKAAV